VLKITINETAKLVTLKLEGRIAGPWVAEFNRTWHSMAPSLATKRLAVDLRGVSYIEPDGRRLLAEIYQRTGAEFQADSLLVGLFAQEAMQGNRTNGKEGTK
jgi:anti-anti-sigma regulatory factor